MLRGRVLSGVSGLVKRMPCLVESSGVVVRVNEDEDSDYGKKLKKELRCGLGTGELGVGVCLAGETCVDEEGLVRPWVRRKWL